MMDITTQELSRTSVTRPTQSVRAQDGVVFLHAILAANVQHEGLEPAAGLLARDSGRDIALVGHGACHAEQRLEALVFQAQLVHLGKGGFQNLVLLRQLIDLGCQLHLSPSLGKGAAHRPDGVRHRALYGNKHPGDDGIEKGDVQHPRGGEPKAHEQQAEQRAHGNV